VRHCGSPHRLDAGCKGDSPRPALIPGREKNLVEGRPDGARSRRFDFFFPFWRPVGAAANRAETLAPSKKAVGLALFLERREKALFDGLQ
jgi:hypothetical protein